MNIKNNINDFFRNSPEKLRTLVETMKRFTETVYQINKVFLTDLK